MATWTSAQTFINKVMHMKYLVRFGVILAVLLYVIPAAPTKAEQIPEDGYLMANIGSGLCVQPEYEAAIDGLAIVQQPCSFSKLYQGWRWGSAGYGLYRFRNTGSGQCLDDKDGATADGSPVQQWTCNSTSTTMLWTMEPLGKINGYQTYQFRNKRSGKCLDVRGGSSAAGAVLQIYRCTSTATSLNYAQVFWLY